MLWFDDAIRVFIIRTKFTLCRTSLYIWWFSLILPSLVTPLADCFPDPKKPNKKKFNHFHFFAFCLSDCYIFLSICFSLYGAYVNVFSDIFRAVCCRYILTIRKLYRVQHGFQTAEFLNYCTSHFVFEFKCNFFILFVVSFFFFVLNVLVHLQGLVNSLTRIVTNYRRI